MALTDHSNVLEAAHRSNRAVKSFELEQPAHKMCTILITKDSGQLRELCGIIQTISGNSGMSAAVAVHRCQSVLGTSVTVRCRNSL